MIFTKNSGEWTIPFTTISIFFLCYFLLVVRVTLAFSFHVDVTEYLSNTRDKRRAQKRNLIEQYGNKTLQRRAQNEDPREIRNLGLQRSIRDDGLLYSRRNPNSPPIDYVNHPYERRSLLSTQTPPKDWNLFKPIRIKTETRYLPSDDWHNAKNKLMETVVLPAAVRFWKKALMVHPANILKIDTDYCSLASNSDFINGITDVDLQIYVTAERFCGNGDVDDQPETIASADSCDWDQFERPIGGIIDFCYDTFVMNEDGSASDETVQMLVDVSIHEIGHILGLQSRDMAFYWDRRTGRPQTPKPMTPSKGVRCVTGKITEEEDRIYLPSRRTLQFHAHYPGIPFFEVVTPTVKQVARNHFNCDSMNGIRLENQPTSDDCFGNHWEERLAWDESLSAHKTSKSIPDSLSPFTLALLEDTGWYRANFTMSRIISFGHGAGCSFVEKPCIVKNNLPNYSKGYFCNSTGQQDYACDPSHSQISLCDLQNLKQSVPYVYRYFDNKFLGPKIFKQADFCPMPIDFIFSCKRPIPKILGSLKIFPEEKFAKSSRCYNSNYTRPLCLETFCDKDNHAIKVSLGKGRTATCSDDKQISIPHPDNEKILVSIECPRLATLCPDLICPTNCAGRGLCDWNSSNPKCLCFDGNKQSETCEWHENVGKTLEKKKTPKKVKNVGKTLEKKKTPKKVKTRTQPDQMSGTSLPSFQTMYLLIGWALGLTFYYYE